MVKLICQDNPEDYKKRFFSFIIFKIERRYSLYLFLLCFICFSGKSQIYEKKKGSIPITKGTTFVSKNSIADSSASATIYITEGTIVTGLRQSIKSGVRIAYLKNKHPQKNLKPLKLTKSQPAIASESKKATPKITFKNSGNDRTFLILTNKFLTAVMANSTHYPKLSGILKSDHLHLPFSSRDNVPVQKMDDSILSFYTSGFYSIRPPPVCYFFKTVL